MSENLNMLLALLRLQSSRFDRCFSQSERWAATTDVLDLIRTIEAAIAKLEATGDPYAQARARMYRWKLEELRMQYRPYFAFGGGA